MTQKHTETPWTLGKGTVRIRNAENVLVAECYTTGNSIRYPGKEEREANAEFIVRACNSHAKLVEALKAIAGNSGCQDTKDIANAALSELGEDK
jgi:hypothetical protein